MLIFHWGVRCAKIKLSCKTGEMFSLVELRGLWILVNVQIQNNKHSLSQYRQDGKTNRKYIINCNLKKKKLQSKNST